MAGQLWALGVHRLAGIALHCPIAQLWCFQGSTQANETGQLAVFIGRGAQVAVGLTGRLAHAQQENRHAVTRVHRQHVVVVLTGLTGRVAQLVAHAWAHVAQFFGLGGLVARTQALINGVAQIDLAHIHCGALGACATGHVFHVDHTQPGELQRQFVIAIGQVGGATNGALDLKRLGGCRHGHGLQLDAGATVVKAGLVNVDALEARRVVHLDACFTLLAGGLVVDDDVAGKQLGHAGRVVLDDELFQLDDKGQILQQDAIGLVQDGGARSRVFGHQQIGAEGRVAIGQTVLRGHIGNQATTVVNFLTAKPHLGTHSQVAIEQTAHTHQHNGRVRRDVTDLVGRTRFCRQHPALARRGVALLQLDFPATGGQ